MEAWTDITSDASILSYERGFPIEFDELPHQMCSPKAIQFNPEEMVLIDQEIKLLLDRKIIEKVKNSDEDDFISNIFIRPKKNGKQRVIMNLKRFNNCVVYRHIKMETIKAAISLISKDCYMASIDLLFL